MHKQSTTIIIGAGLSGLYIAWRLYQQQQDVVLLEARKRTGGRVLSLQVGEHVDSCIDMGPAWVWPDLQPRLSQLVTDLDVKLFKQFTTGDILYERDANNVERYGGQSSHNQSYRITGGARALIDALQSKVPELSIHLNTQVISIDQSSLNVEAICDGKPCLFSADKIITALPPRLIQQNIKFKPPLDEKIISLWKNTPTWMAGHSKLVFIYEKAFWREQNLSGEVFSQQGPLTEIYDASPESESFYALTSFVGLSSHQRQQISAEKLIELCMVQLQRLFGDASHNVKDIKIKDWSIDQCTTTGIDLQTMPQHPQYPESAPRGFSNNNIILAGTEVAVEHGGYLEGALESADAAILLSKDHS